MRRALPVTVIVFLSVVFCLALTGPAVVVPARADSPPSLIAHRWQLSELNGQTIQTAQKPWIRLDDNGRVKGMAVCNSFSGRYQQLGETLRFGPLVSTRQTCPAAEPSENTFFEALARCAVFRIRDRTLMLSDGVHLLAVFSLPTDPVATPPAGD